MGWLRSFPHQISRRRLMVFITSLHPPDRKNSIHPSQKLSLILTKPLKNRWSFLSPPFCSTYLTSRKTVPTAWQFGNGSFQCLYPAPNVSSQVGVSKSWKHNAAIAAWPCGAIGEIQPRWLLWSSRADLKEVTKVQPVLIMGNPRTPSPQQIMVVL